MSSFKLQTTTMATSGLRDEIKPRRFDLTMSRRTRRPAPAATSAQDRHQAVDVEGLGFQPVVVQVQPERQDPDGLLFCLSDHLQSRQPPELLLDAHQEHETSSEQQQPEEEEECQDNSRRFSLQELIEDEAVGFDVGGVKGAATGGTEENAAAAREVAEDEAKRSDQVVAGRRVIGIMRRYVKVRSVKPKRASPEKKNAAPVC